MAKGRVRRDTRNKLLNRMIIDSVHLLSYILHNKTEFWKVMLYFPCDVFVMPSRSGKKKVFLLQV